MKQVIVYKIAIYGLLFLFVCSLIFHTLVLTGVISFDIIWGGRINSSSEMYVFEAISLSTNVLFLLIILLKARFLNLNISQKLINIGVWLMAILFALNTVGNLFSNNQMEKAIFTPLTFISAIFCFILAMNKSKSEA
jgi:hypothetical protein